MSDISECPAQQDPIQRLPPERRQPKSRSVILYSCCCCCCCCLHSFGAALGAALGGNYQAVDNSASPPRTLPSSQWLYWSSFAYAVVLGGVAYSILVASGGSSGRAWQTAIEYIPVTIGLTIIFFGPAWLLAAAALMALRLTLRRDLRTRYEYRGQLGRITVGIVLGTLAGTGIMLLLALPFLLPLAR